MRSANSATGRLATALGLTLVLFASMGASCSPRSGSIFGSAGPAAPVVLQPTATAADVVAAVNANSDRVRTYQAQQASISMPESVGLPLVSASIAVERPQRFRLRATTALTGPEVDLGSNDERFWVWARRNEPPALYTARHDLWAAAPASRQVPIEPAWLIEALGLVRLDPNAAYVGPLPRDNGTLELRAQVQGPSGQQQRVFIIDNQTASIREQHVYDSSGSLSASVFADRFRYDAAAQVSLPQRVRVSVPASGLDLTINTGDVVINAPVGDGGQLWALPQIGSYPVVDLTTPGATPVASSGPWDLAGVGSTYGQPPAIAEPYATAEQDGWRSSVRQAPVATATPNAYPTAPSVYPVAQPPGASPAEMPAAQQPEVAPRQEYAPDPSFARLPTAGMAIE